jgi:hypothetical protein
MVFPSHEELLDAIGELVTGIESKTLTAVSEHWMERLEWVSKNNGDYYPLTNSWLISFPPLSISNRVAKPEWDTQYNIDNCDCSDFEFMRSDIVWRQIKIWEVMRMLNDSLLFLSPATISINFRDAVVMICGFPGVESSRQEAAIQKHRHHDQARRPSSNRHPSPHLVPGPNVKTDRRELSYWRAGL